jgi:hypothetical protein
VELITTVRLVEVSMNAAAMLTADVKLCVWHLRWLLTQTSNEVMSTSTCLIWWKAKSKIEIVNLL